MEFGLGRWLARNRIVLRPPPQVFKDVQGQRISDHLGVRQFETALAGSLSTARVAARCLVPAVNRNHWPYRQREYKVRLSNRSPYPPKRSCNWRLNFEIKKLSG